MNTTDRLDWLRSFRRYRTDLYRQFVEYAAGQGSQNGQMYYAHLTRLSNAVAGVTHRRDATEQGLQSISTAEVMICLYIVDGMRLGLPYRQIYQNCKAAVLVMKGEKQ